MSTGPRNKKPIPLFDVKVARQTLAEVRKTLTGGWLTTGPRVAQFERLLSKRLGVTHSVALNSGSAALLLTLRALGASAGKQVITTPFTFVSTIEAIVQAGATPVLADIQPDTLNIDPPDVERKLTRNTMAVLSVDMAGYPVDYAELRRICDVNSIALVADAAHAFGALYRGKSMAQLADAAVYSFYSTKNLTCGEGGLVASRNGALVEQVRSLARHGLTSATIDRRKKSGHGYDISLVGFKASMSDVHAAIGLGQLSVFDHEQEKRRKLAERYDRNLRPLLELLTLPHRQPERTHSWHMYIVQLESDALTVDRDRVLELMSREGIECGVHFRPVTEMAAYRRLLHVNEKLCPKARAAGLRVLTLPLYPSLRLKDVDFICDRLYQVLQSHRR